MAGLNKSGEFSEKISPFLKKKLIELKETYGEDSEEYNAIYFQYIKQDDETQNTKEDNNRHWEADLIFDGQEHGVERLYNKCAVLEPTLICAAHCRYCLRANYDMFTLSEGELTKLARFAGSKLVKDTLNEVLLTGGDPLVVPKRLGFLVDEIVKHAPNVKIIRIATRLPLHNPSRIDNNIFEVFTKHKDKVRFELATQINHEIDLFPESVEAYQKFMNLGVRVYSQNVLLKGVNDNINTLVKLYNRMREVDIESHYLFHCVPMKGMPHFRTTVAKGIELAKQLSNSGLVSGRAKPMYCCMTDIGKITMYDGTYVRKDEDKNMVLLRSSYKYETRMENNPNWKLPKTAEVTDDGHLQMWYLDGTD